MNLKYNEEVLQRKHAGYWSGVSLLQKGQSEQEFYGDLVFKLKNKCQ